MIPRPQYIQPLLEAMEVDIIKVIIGQRRVGKSTIMKELIERLVDQWVSPKDILYINKELAQWHHLKDHQALLDEYQGQTYVFVDEVQDISERQLAIRDLSARWWVNITISGSNSSLLSGEFATYLTGRYISFTVWWLSWIEYQRFFPHATDKEKLRLQYLQFWWLPSTTEFIDKPSIMQNYLSDVSETIIFKDIIARYNIRKVRFMKSLMVFLAKSIGSLFSANSIKKYGEWQKLERTVPTILSYLGYGTDAILIHEVPRYDIKAKSVFQVKHKWYYTDLGLRNYLAGWFQQKDISGLLENIVFLHLRMYGRTVMTGEHDGKEIDFVASKNNQQLYIQVSYRLTEESTIEREFGNLQAVRNQRPKIVLSMESNDRWSIEGVQHFNIPHRIENVLPTLG